MSPSDLFDTYSLRARYLPAVLILLGPLAETWLFFPKLYSRVGASLSAAGAIFAGVSVALVLLYLVAHFLRASGRKAEKRINAKNGDFPSTLWLRHRDSNLPPATKARYHAFLTKNVGNLQLPNESQEQQRPQFADEQYRSAVNWLVNTLTRDAAKYPMVFAENVNYGFRRNMLGGKWLGVLLCVLPVLAAGALAVYHHAPSELLEMDAVAASTIAVVDTCVLLFLVTESWVVDASHAYARALLAACEG